MISMGGIIQRLVAVHETVRGIRSDETESESESVDFKVSVDR
jgi:hypothetical protein